MAYYQSEKCFRIYEKIIATALDKYPESVRFKSSTRNCITDSARCQNAISQYRKVQWPSVYPVFAYFEERPLSVWIEKDHCVIGPSRSKDNVEIIEGPGDGLHGSIKVSPTQPSEVRALIHMVNNGVITDPIELPLDYQDFVQKEIEGLMNIAVRVEVHSVIIF